MYESTEMSFPWYSVSPHFSLTTTLSLTSSWRKGRGFLGTIYSTMSARNPLRGGRLRKMSSQ